MLIAHSVKVHYFANLRANINGYDVYFNHYLLIYVEATLVSLTLKNFVKAIGGPIGPKKHFLVRDSPEFTEFTRFDLM